MEQVGSGGSVSNLFREMPSSNSDKAIYYNVWGFSSIAQFHTPNSEIAN